MKYRRDIDGLRALAVVPVVFFHAGFPAFEGGYIGVDIFFVISGFLITRVILNEIENKKFSITSFYERRARRIMPALLTTVIFAFAAAWIILIPSDMKDFAQSMAAVSLFSSNLLFWMETGYWDTTAELKPLLHTWSLAVEEQYYILFPVLLIALAGKSRKTLLVILTFASVVSIILAEATVRTYPSFAFYLLPTRIWELAIGAIASLVNLHPKIQFDGSEQNNLNLSILKACALLMIVVPIFAFNDEIPYPSYYTLIPTAGTALILTLGSDKTLVTRILSAPIMVGIGLVSYSAYLFHQPIFAFYRNISISQTDPINFLPLIGLNFLLAYFCWLVIEKPFRDRRKFSRRTIFLMSGVGSFVILILGLAGHFSGGWPSRVPEPLRVAGQDKGCRSTAFSENSVCTYVKTANNSAILIGDSHAGALASALAQRLKDENIGFKHIHRVQCPPIENVYRADKGPAEKLGATSCYQFNKNLFDYLRKDQTVSTVILVARWTLSFEGTRFNNMEGGIENSPLKPHLDLVENGLPQYHGDYSHRTKLAVALKNTVLRLLATGKSVILVYPIPEAGWHVPRMLQKYYLHNGSQTPPLEYASIDYKVFIQRNLRTHSYLDNIGYHNRLFRIHPEAKLCNKHVPRRCITQFENHPLYKDDNHLSETGASIIIDPIVELLKSTGNH